MASRSFVSGCGRFLASSDGHDRCVSCLGYQHAEAALVDDSCSLNMTIAILRSRYLLVKRGGIPLAMPRSSSSGSRGLLRLMVRVTWGSQWELPRRVRLRGPLTPPAHRTSGVPDELVASSSVINHPRRWGGLRVCGDPPSRARYCHAALPAKRRRLEGNPRLPSRACKFSSALTAKAYSAAGQALPPCMPWPSCKSHQAKALKQLHKGGAWPRCVAGTVHSDDLALRATKSQRGPWVRRCPR